MYRPRLTLSAFGWANPEWLAVLVAGLVDVMACNNELIIRKVNPPRLYDTRVVWREPPGLSDPYRDLIQVYRSGFGDCDALSAIRIAEERIKGYPAEPHVTFERDGNVNTFHIAMRTRWGVEDPSRLLGMP